MPNNVFQPTGLAFGSAGACGPKERQYMGTVNDLDGPALVVNACEPFKLTLKKRPNNTLQPTSALTGLRRYAALNPRTSESRS